MFYLFNKNELLRFLCVAAFLCITFDNSSEGPLFGIRIGAKAKATPPLYYADTIAGTGDYDAALLSGTPKNYLTGPDVFAEPTDSYFATSAVLANAVAIVKDATDGSLIFIDHDHAAIRRITPAGIVSTILSGFNKNFYTDGGGHTVYTIPNYLAIDALGRLYSTDGQNVFVIPKSNGNYGTPSILATFRNDSTATLGWSVSPAYDPNCVFHFGEGNPQGIAFAPAGSYGYLYIGDVDCIYQIDLNTANSVSNHYNFTQIVSGLNYPTGLTLNSTNTSLCVVDNPVGNASSVVRSYLTSLFSDGMGAPVAAASGDIITGYLSTSLNGPIIPAGSWNPATNAQLNKVTNIAFDNAGNLYIVDQGYSSIFMVNTSNQITKIAGGGSGGTASTDNGILGTSAQLMAPSGLFVDLDGRIFFTEGSNSADTNHTNKNLIRTLYTAPGDWIVPSGTTLPLNNLSLSYYDVVKISGGGTLTASTDNSNSTYGKIILDNTTLVLDNLNGLGNATASTNKLTIVNGGCLRASSGLNSVNNPAASIIPMPIEYSGDALLDTNGCYITTSRQITCIGQDNSLNRFIIKGTGKYKPGATYNSSTHNNVTEIIATIGLGTIFELVNSTYTPTHVAIGMGATLLQKASITYLRWGFRY